MSEPLILLKEVTKHYTMGPKGVSALNGLNLEVPGGVMAAIVGKSGSGKTTLLNMLGALDSPTSGEIYVDSMKLNNLAEKELFEYRRKRIGFVFQDYNLIPTLNALENVMLPMEYASVPKHQARQRAQELLKAVSMDHRASHRPSRLSGGEQQRVAIARALANDPILILADEPTGNLDTETGKEIVTLMSELVRERKKTVVVVTHDEAIRQEANLNFTIRDGRILD